MVHRSQGGGQEINQRQQRQNVTLRPATATDCRDIAKLFLISSDGLAEYIWSRMEAGPDMSLEDIGSARYAREDVAFSYQNCLIAEIDRKTVGMLHAFVMPESDREIESDPVLRPYAELEDPGSLYISGVALFPEYRGAGIGSRLLAAAEKRARDAGAPRVSLVCFEENGRALALYVRGGYEIRDRRPIVPHATLHYDTGDALLLVKPVG